MQNPKKICIFDIDGTLSNLEHRRNYVRRKPANWGAFNATMGEDGRNEVVIDTFNALCATGDYHMVIFTGRSDRFREVTETWLSDNGINYDELHMRTHTDESNHVRDSIVKKAMLDDLIARHPDKKIMGVFDDRLQVVEMWIENGIWVFDVGQGRGDF